MTHGDGVGATEARPDREPGEPEILVLPDVESASVVSAVRIAEALIEAIDARGVAHWVTTGGSTPAPIYRELAREPLRDAVRWDRVHVWWTDDRWVPPDDPLSNTIDFGEILLPGLSLPAGQVHVIPIAEALAAGEGPGWAAGRYAAELGAAGLPIDATGFPILDIVLVGIGSDGHLFSVFPGSATWNDSAWVQAVPAPTHIEPHVERITLHPRILEVARLPMAVTHGPSKAELVGRIFGAREDENALPAQLARRTGGVWILDEAAAAQIPGEIRAAGAG